MDEKNELDQQESTLPPCPAADTDMPGPAEELSTAEDAQASAPAADMVFGLPRRTFHLVVVGYALGVIAVGVLGLAGLVADNSSVLLPGVAGAAIGYFLGRYLDKRDAGNPSDGSSQ